MSRVTKTLLCVGIIIGVMSLGGCKNDATSGTLTKEQAAAFEQAKKDTLAEMKQMSPPDRMQYIIDNPSIIQDLKDDPSLREELRPLLREAMASKNRRGVMRRK